MLYILAAVKRATYQLPEAGRLAPGKGMAINDYKDETLLSRDGTAGFSVEKGGGRHGDEGKILSGFGGHT